MIIKSAMINDRDIENDSMRRSANAALPSSEELLAHHGGELEEIMRLRIQNPGNRIVASSFQLPERMNGAQSAAARHPRYPRYSCLDFLKDARGGAS